MKDTIIKGNGKSQIIKAPEDMPETYIEWRNQAIQGRTFFDIGLNTEVENENSGCDVIGTPLNKTTLLSDKTKSSLQLEGEDPTVNDALYKLSSMRAQPNGIATLNSSGKLVQMPTAADVGAEPKLTVTDYSAQVVEMNGFKSYLIVKKMGHLVVIKNYIDKGSGTYSATNGARVATLPAAVAPSSIMYFACTAYNFAGDEYPAHATISANGLVITYAPASATIAIIDAVYLV